MAKKPGSIWVDGGELHYVDATGREWFWLGDNLGAELTAKEGSVWLDTAAGPGLNRIHYITTGPNHRFIPSSSVLHHVDANAEQGSLWVEGDFLHFISNAAGQEIQAHMDIAHQDNAHSDVAHTDHTDHDDHDDGGHQDHDDSAPHQDSPHSDGDAHCDIFEDGGGSGFECLIHCDHDDGGLHGDAHDDHNDGTGSFFCHIDQGGHGDSPHGDHTDHGDVSHTDGTHEDHDDHSDVPHLDSAHTDTGHDDRPVFVGP